MNYREFRSRFRIIPFGKFSSSGRGKEPFNQVFVGRASERARIIEALVHQEKFGSLLVSGRRGSGKTSFVDYVLEEYQQSAFHRFIRFSRRNGIPDLFACLGLAFAIAVALVFITQLLELLTINIALLLNHKNEFAAYLSWTLVAVLLVMPIVLGLFRLALHGYSAVSQLARRSVNSTILGGLLSGVFVVAVIDLFLLTGALSNGFVEWINSLVNWSDIKTSATHSSLNIQFLIALIVLIVCGRWGFQKLKPKRKFFLFLVVALCGLSILGLVYQFQPQFGLWDLFLPAALIFGMLVTWKIIALAKRIKYLKARNVAGMITGLLSMTTFGCVYTYLLWQVPSNPGFFFWIILSTILGMSLFFTVRYFKTHSQRNYKAITPSLIRLRYSLFFLVVFTLSYVFRAEIKEWVAANLTDKLGLSLGLIVAVFILNSLILAQACVSAIPIFSNPKSHLFRWLLKPERARVFVQFFEMMISTCFFVMQWYAFWTIGAEKSVDVQNIISLQQSNILVLICVSSVSLLGYTDMLRMPPNSSSKTSIVQGNNLAITIVIIAIFIGWIIAQQQLRLSIPVLLFFILPPLVALISLFLKRLWLRDSMYHDKRPPEYNFFNRVPLEFVLTLKSTVLILIGAALLLFVLRVVFPTTEFGDARLVLTWGDLLVLVVLISLFFCVEYSWISRSLNAERQDEPIVPLGRESQHAQIERLWSDTERGVPKRKHAGRFGVGRYKVDIPDWWDRRNSNPLLASSRSAGGLSQRRRYITRRLEQATLAHFFYDMRVPVIISRINLGFDDLRHSRIIEAMLVQLRDRYREHFKSPSSKVGFTGLMLMIGLTLILTNLLSNNFFAQQTDADGNPVLIQSELRLEDEEGKGPATYDYCGYFKLKPSDLRPTATGIICLLPWSNSLFDLLYTPVLRLRYIGGDSRMIDGETSVRDYLNKDKSVPPFPYSFRVNDDSLIFRLFLDRNFDLPSVKPGKEVGRLFNSDEESVQTWRIENGELSITTLKTSLTAPTELMELPHSPILWKAQPTFRVYHILIMFCVWFALMSINRTLKIWPYASRMEEMSRLLELIRGRITQTNVDTPKVGWFRWVLGLKRHDESIETTPDARVVEQAFIDLLRRLNPNHEGPRPFFSTWFEIRPEMVFVFDEMDKLSGKVDPETSRVDEAAASVEENTRERQRALQLHRLLSDMKRLLSSNSARFIFIGGRLYHDEWLADQVDRTPLLSSIFSEQIYLPSMLTDRDHSYGRFNDRIAEYLILMFRNAEHRMNHRKLKHQSLPFVGSTGLSKPTYVQGNLPHSGHPKRMAMMAHYVNMRVRDEFGQHYGTPFNTGHLQLDEFGQRPDTHSNIEQLQKQEAIHLTSGEIETLEQLLNFLTYRSAGNPKKMKELLQSLIVPSSNAFQLSRYKSIEQKSVRFQMHPALPIDRPEGGHHHDCILLDDKRLYRIQFIDVLYRHLTEHLESRMLERDDKVAMSIFYLMDFLLKFHNRGFSWTNLQRVDELSHIHRAPDLRSMMGVLVEVSSERFLHRVWNGVYAFRFRSDFAREIDYLSRISKEEMAALNFTLDESQDLKGLYQETIRRGDHENVDTISGLGELYEYDQDFEIARNYYRRALEVLDASFLNSYAPSLGTSSAETVTIADEWKALGSGAKISSNKDDDTMFRPMGLILSAPDSPESKRAISSNFSWAIARLRLLLQIGHTYEQERNFERALGTYMHAQSFSQAILDAQPAQDLTRLDSHLDLTRGVITPENYSILYQASMAGAWVFEKGNQDPDDSIAHAERSVFRLYNKNPMLWRQRLSELSGDQATLRQMKLGIRLFASDLHDRVGDLYFYKGKQSLRQIKNLESYQQIDHNSEDSLRFGYLLEAHYHYALSIWNIRNYLGLRRRSSGTRLNIMAKPKELGSLESPFYGKTTIKGDGVFPDLIHNNLANTFTDMSEAILARSAIGELLRDYMELPAIDQSAAINIPPARDRFRQQLGDCVREFTKRISYTEDNEFVPPKVDELKEYRLYSIHEDASQSRSIKIFDRTIEAASGGVWLGDGTGWADRYEQYSKERTLQFRTIVKQDHRFNAAIYFSNVAAKNFAIAGYSIDAASEYLLQAQTLIGLMWTMRQTKWMAKEGAANARENVRKMLFPVHELDQRGFPKFGFIKLLKAFSRDSDTSQSLQKYLTELLCPSALKQGQTESDIRDKWHRYLSDKRRTIISSKWDNFLMSNLISDKESSWRRLEDWTRASVDPLETAKMHLALMAHTALRRAAKAILISYRPSATRYGQNHGDPNKFENDIIRKAREVVFQVVLETPQLVHKAPLRNHIYSKPIGTGDGLDKVAVLRGLTELLGTELQDDDIRSFVNSLIEGNETMANTNFSRNDLRISEETYKSIKFLVDRLRELRADDSSVSNATQGNTRFNADRKQELEQDYQMSQSWKDEPRLTTLAAQLVLGLAEQTGKDGLCNKMAVDVYDNFLREYAKDQFPRLSEDQVVKNRQIDIIRKTYNGLHNQTEKFRFPILNRLRSLRVMCDAAIFHGPVVLDQYDGEDENKIYREHAGLIGHLCSEMSFTYDLYDSETHFSPHLLGTSLGLAFFYCVRNGHRVLYDVNTGDEWDEERVEEFVTTKTRDWKDKPTLSSVTITRESLAEISLNLLRRSEQMYSLGKAYYENIAHMQYLNDDFNDRITHYNQATRMMYSEFTSCMIGAVHDELFH